MLPWVWLSSDHSKEVPGRLLDAVSERVEPSQNWLPPLMETSGVGRRVNCCWAVAEHPFVVPVTV